MDAEPQTPAEPTQAPETTRKRFRVTGAQLVLLFALLLFVIGVELLVAAYFPEASVTELIPGLTPSPEAQRAASSEEFKQNEPYAGLSKPVEPLLTDAKRGYAEPGGAIVLDGIRGVLSFDPPRPVVGEQTKVIWTLRNDQGEPLGAANWDRSVPRTQNHSYLMRSDFMSDMFHVHPSVKEDGTMTETVQFPTGGEWAISSQLAHGGTTYFFTSTFPVYLSDGTLPADPPATQPNSVTGERGIDFTRTLPLDSWDVHMEIEGGEPVRAGVPFTVEWVAEPRDGKNAPELRGGILDGGHNILIAPLHDPSRVWNTHGDRSAEAVSHLLGIPTRRWPTRENPFKYTMAFMEAGTYLVHFEIQSKPVHFFLNVAENPNAPETVTLPSFDETTGARTDKTQTIFQSLLER